MKSRGPMDHEQPERPASEADPLDSYGDSLPATSSGPADPPSVRDDIPIPDIKLLRRIGSGAYGEVWLARTITGALRAVKVVWREDFEYEKTFQREFEGIKQFEPISRGHRGLMNILHVGWNENVGFYYCVMELADDAEHGQSIDPYSYLPRTLTTDFKRLGRLDLKYCQEIGLYLADALGYMHSYGLTHRDIKPSNIIFVDGMCKLADIGLVATHGERSFVGTEGFVPPEGPGTFAADIYSLGKVLYEISSGKDRMEFPEVPEDLGASEWKLWREWNTVICRACAPNVKERYASAAEFAAALRTVGEPKPVPLSTQLWCGGKRVVTGALLIGTALAITKREAGWAYAVQAPEARVFTAAELAKAKLPAPGRMWLNGFDSKFSWNNSRHVADKLVNLDQFTTFLEATMQSFEGEVLSHRPKGGGETEYLVVVPKADANSFCAWLTDRDREAGSLNEEFEYRWKPDGTVKPTAGSNGNWSAIRLELAKLQFGMVLVESTPPQAEVIREGETLGHTPLNLPRVRVGEVAFILNFPGYKRETLKGKVMPGKRLNLTAKLRPTDAVAFGSKWRNSLGMDFEPIGPVLFAVTETRRADHAAWVRSQPFSSVPKVELNNDVLLPMTHVSREDAMQFCRWLTHVERSKGLLESGQSYRLPTDEEWSMAANLPRERGDSPADRNQRITGIYPWMFGWPPPLPPQANLWDLSAAGKENKKDGIPGYDDGFPGLAPTGSYPGNDRNLLKDLGGNVWEWVRDDFGGADDKRQKQGVLRGGSWRTFSREELLSSFRRAEDSSLLSDDVGYRIVLSEEGVSAREDDFLER